MSRKRARLIYNPSAGREAITKELPEILQIYENAGYETSAFQTTPEVNSAFKEASRVADEKFDLLIVAGGDGTINEVISGIAEKSYRPPIALIPAGTANDLATSLKIPTNSLVEAAKVIDKHDYVPMDIGKMISESGRRRYFMNVAATGAMTELTYEVSPQLKTNFGYLAYLIKGAQMLPQISAEPIRVKYDGGIFEGEASFVFIALTSTIGGFRRIAPEKVIGDGEFSLFIVKSDNIVKLLELVRLIYRDQTHINSDAIVYKRTNFVEIENLSNQQMMINIDGEYGGDVPATFENMQQHIHFVADKEKVNAVTTIEAQELSAYEIEIMQKLADRERELKS